MVTIIEEPIPKKDQVQQELTTPGTREERYICESCGLPCKLTETVSEATIYPRTVPPACQRFPSRKPEWKKVE